MKKLSYEEKVKKEILKNSRLKIIPRNDNKIIPIFHTCGMCKMNKVTDHHFLCNKCWKEKHKSKYDDKNA